MEFEKLALTDGDKIRKIAEEVLEPLIIMNRL